MLHNTSGKGSRPESPPPPPLQQIDEPKTAIYDDEINLPEIKLDSATGVVQLTMLKNHHINQQSDDRPADDFIDISQRKQRRSRSRRRMSKKNLRRQHERDKEIYREAQHNARDTITLVAILVATFTYTAGINPPGGVYQDGPLIGTSVAARKTAFRVFSVCNNLALFTSICVVLVFVSIIPFKRKALMRMLTIAHKVIWVAVSFMAAAYVAAAMVIMQPPSLQRGVDWTIVFLLSICAGSLGTLSVGLGIMIVKQRLTKGKWRQQHARRRAREKLVEEYSTEDDETESVSKENSSHASSIISDIPISNAPWDFICLEAEQAPPTLMVMDDEENLEITMLQSGTGELTEENDPINMNRQSDNSPGDDFIEDLKALESGPGEPSNSGAQAKTKE